MVTQKIQDKQKAADMASIAGRVELSDAFIRKAFDKARQDGKTHIVLFRYDPAFLPDDVKGDVTEYPESPIMFDYESFYLIEDMETFDAANSADVTRALKNVLYKTSVLDGNTYVPGYMQANPFGISGKENTGIIDLSRSFSNAHIAFEDLPQNVKDTLTALRYAYQYHRHSTWFDRTILRKPKPEFTAEQLVAA